MSISDYSEKSYFAAANSRYGFVSFFDKIFTPEELDFLYIIKGGSGTGKSSMMKAIADKAKRLGEEVEYFYCSSDPKSLDGIILKERRVGIIDGTAPHVYEPRLPGCFDEIINLGAFWDSKKLIESKEKIVDICNRKSRLYTQAYSYLSVAGKLEGVCDSIMQPSIKKDKLSKWAQRFLMRCTPGGTYTQKVRLTDAISSLGRTHIDSYYKAAAEHFIIADSLNISSFVFGALSNAAKEQRISMTASYDPLDTTKINGIYFTDSSVSVTLKDSKAGTAYDRVINTERFFDRESYRNVRQRVRFMNKCKVSMYESAVEVMKTTSALHSELEEIYCKAMNFDAKEEYTKALVKRIFG